MPTIASEADDGTTIVQADRAGEYLFTDGKSVWLSADGAPDNRETEMCADAEAFLSAARSVANGEWGTRQQGGLMISPRFDSHSPVLYVTGAPRAGSFYRQNTDPEEVGEAIRMAQQHNDIER